VVDFFPEDSGELMFNKAPVIKGAKVPKKTKKEKKSSVFQDKDDLSLESLEKKVKLHDTIFEDEEAFFSKFN